MAGEAGSGEASAIAQRAKRWLGLAARRLGLDVLLQRLGWRARAVRERAVAQTKGALRPLARPTLWREAWEASRPIAKPLLAIAGLGAAAWIGAALLIAYVWPAALSPVVDRGAFAGFERAANRASGVALIDGKGRRFGVLSGEFDRDHLGELPGSLFFGGLAVHPDHKTIPVADAPETFWRCLVWLEDRGRGGWDNPYGVSFTGVLRIPYAMALRAIGGRDPGGAAGGSTLEMQLARSMWKQYRHNSNPLIRKVREWRAAPVLNRALAQPDGGRPFRAWIASHIALVRGVGGDQGSLYGVELAGRYLFGEGAAALDVGEQALLAAAARRPIRLRETEAQRRRALAALAGSEAEPGRALRCLSAEAMLPDGPVVRDPKARAAARRKLLSLAATPYRGPFLDAEIAALLPDLVAFPGGPRLEPQSVSRRLALPLQAELAAELADRFAASPEARRDAHLWRGKLTSLTTSVDVAASNHLKKRALAALERSLAAQKAARPPRLAPSAFTPDGAPFLLMAMDLEGRVLRYAQTGYDSLALGSAATRPDWGAFGDGPHEARLRTAQIGSLGKIGAALLLAEAGAEDPNRRTSNVCVSPLRFRCMNPETGRGAVPSVTLEGAFAASLSSAVIRALRREGVSNARIEAFAEGVGLATPAPERATSAKTRLALGRMTGRPVEALRLMAAALAYAEGDYDRWIPRPHFIQSIGALSGEKKNADASESYERGGDPLQRLIAPAVAREKGRNLVRRILRAPLCLPDHVPHATVRRLAAWCDAARDDVALHLAKTGTVSAGGMRPTPEGSYDEAAWWLAGGVRFSDGRGYVYLAMAGRGETSRPFARRLGAGRLSVAVDALLRDLAATRE